MRPQPPSTHPSRRRALGPILSGLWLLSAIAPLPAAAQVAPDPSAIDEIFAEWDREGSPGCAVGVYNQGMLVLERSYGEANLDWGIPITSTTVFYAGSVSKQFAAATAALLHLNGELDLDDDVRRYIPELPNYDAPITIRHLVHHTSGVRDIYGLLSLSGRRVADSWTDTEYLELIAAQRELNFPPGEEYLYSNGAYYLLTTTIERVTGQRLDDAARELIFAPLGMDDTHFHQDRERIVPRRAMSYGGDADAGFRQTFLGNFDKSGAGGLHTTIEDLAAWDRNFETGEVGGADFLSLIQTPGVLNSGDTLSYGFGLQLGESGGRPTVGHGGSFMGFRSDFVRFPEEGISVAALCNLGGINPTPLTRRVAVAALGPGAEGPEEDASPEDADPPSPASLALRDYAGVYHSDEVDASLELRWSGGQLHLITPASLDSRAVDWLEGDRFRSAGWILEFQVDEDRPTALRLDAGRVKNLKYVRGG
ncbi:MAG: serine hydrolase [Gemmatimonadales bacterium]|nr:MAG: serine hydrolase [Gemmatimonadales bacterium]